MVSNMPRQSTRRQFIEAATIGSTAIALPELGFLTQLPHVCAADATLNSKLVRVDSGIEPLVRLLEQTPRQRLLEEVAAKIQAGTSYREVLAALLLAGVRNVQPRPSVGFKFHSVLVVNSAHLASRSSPDTDRWLPIFWAIDYFKATQLEEERTSGWKMSAVDETAIPPASKARSAFIHAMDNWDVEAADAAVAGIARHAGANAVFELFYRYGARDYRSIGHKAIFVANSWRTLQSVGWRHAEPVLRSLAFALLNYGQQNPVSNDLLPDRPWRQNLELQSKIRDTWHDGKVDEKATRTMLATLRSGTHDDAPAQAVELLNQGIAPPSIWDAIFVGSGELLMRQPGIIGLHSLTTANALHYAYQASRDDSTRRMLLLQGCAFIPMFRQSAQDRGSLSDRTIDDLPSLDTSDKVSQEVITDIFADVSGNRARAAAKMHSFLQAGGSVRDVIRSARRLIFLKGHGAHDYKFSSAVLEDYYHVSPQWRDLFLSLSVFNLRGSGDRDNSLVRRTREALG